MNSTHYNVCVGVTIIIQFSGVVVASLFFCIFQLAKLDEDCAWFTWIYVCFQHDVLDGQRRVSQDRESIHEWQ